MKSILLIIILSFKAYATECIDCNKDIPPFKDLVQNIDSIVKTTVVDCEKILKENSMDEYKNNFGNLQQVKQNIKGYNLTGSALELEYLSKMLGDKPNDKWKQAKDCKTVLCALNKVYNSEETAYRVLNIAKRDGYIVSLAKDFNGENGAAIGQAFSPDEIKDIDLAYKLLPPSYKKLKSMDRLKRLPNGYSSPRAPNAAAFASPSIKSKYYNKEGEITFLEDGFSSDKSWGPLVAIHELSHHVDYSASKESRLGISEAEPFLKLSGWTKSKSYQTDPKTGKKIQVEEWKHAKDKKFITDYAATEPAEDFADSCVHYVYAPNKLKNIDPLKYDYIKNNIFKGKEYLSSVELPNKKSELLNICINKKSHYTLYGENNYFTSKITDSCLDDFSKNLKITDPNQCAYNSDQIKNQITDSLASPIEELGQVLKQCDADLKNNQQICMNEGNYHTNCPVLKYFQKNPISSAVLGISPDETTKLENNFIQKIKYQDNLNRDEIIMKSVREKIGQEEFLTTILINGLKNKKRIHPDFPMTRQAEFLNNAIAGLNSKADSKGLQFDSKKDFESITQTYIMTNKELVATITNFQEKVLKMATRSKDKNLELIKNWAKSQNIEESPSFENLAEALR